MSLLCRYGPAFLANGLQDTDRGDDVPCLSFFAARDGRGGVKKGGGTKGALAVSRLGRSFLGNGG